MMSPQSTLHSKESLSKKRTRSRFGCNNCKKMKIKCDERKPHCSNCLKSKKFRNSCDYFLKLSWGGRPYKNAARKVAMQNSGYSSFEGVRNMVPVLCNYKFVQESFDGYYIKVDDEHESDDSAPQSVGTPTEAPAMAHTNSHSSIKIKQEEEQFMQRFDSMDDEDGQFTSDLFTDFQHTIPRFSNNAASLFNTKRRNTDTSVLPKTNAVNSSFNSRNHDPDFPSFENFQRSAFATKQEFGSSNRSTEYHSSSSDDNNSMDEDYNGTSDSESLINSAFRYDKKDNYGGISMATSHSDNSANKPIEIKEEFSSLFDTKSVNFKSANNNARKEAPKMSFDDSNSTSSTSLSFKDEDLFAKYINISTNNNNDINLQSFGNGNGNTHSTSNQVENMNSNNALQNSSSNNDLMFLKNMNLERVESCVSLSNLKLFPSLNNMENLLNI